MQFDASRLSLSINGALVYENSMPVAFDATGRTLVTHEGGGRIATWDVITGKQLGFRQGVSGAGSIERDTQLFDFDFSCRLNERFAGRRRAEQARRGVAGFDCGGDGRRGEGSRRFHS